MARTITEILKDADKATSLNDLKYLWKEIVTNKYKYPLVQIWFAIEHIQDLVKKTLQAKRLINTNYKE